MKTFRCLSCRRILPLSHRNPTQQYCRQPECQRARKRAWQRMKRQTDPDYRQNQSDAQKRWRQTHPDYWQTYRKKKKETPEPAEPTAAKMDQISQEFPVIAGEYLLAPVKSSCLKNDAMRVILLPISDSYDPTRDDLIGKIAAFTYNCLQHHKQKQKPHCSYSEK